MTIRHLIYFNKNKAGIFYKKNTNIIIGSLKIYPTLEK